VKSKLFERIRKAAKRLHDEQESGVAMTEFAIAFPLQFFVTLALMQFSLLLIGHVLTEQAAFGAARAALVWDVPQDGQTNATQQQIAQKQGDEAKRAACYVIMAVCPKNNDPEYSSFPNSPANAIAFKGADDSSNAAWALTNVQITTGPNENYVGALVEFDFPLIIPVVNHWFAKLGPDGAGNPGQFWYGPNTNGRNTYNSASQQRGVTVYRLRKSAFLPRPWKAQ